MIRLGKQDFFVHEPTLLRSGTACIPFRWFRRNGKYFGSAYTLELMTKRRPTDGWRLREEVQMEICEDDLSLSLPLFVTSAAANKLPSPHDIRGK